MLRRVWRFMHAEKGLEGLCMLRKDLEAMSCHGKCNKGHVVRRIWRLCVLGHV
jgi:hypothetical protein